MSKKYAPTYDLDITYDYSYDNLAKLREKGETVVDILENRSRTIAKSVWDLDLNEFKNLTHSGIINSLGKAFLETIQLEEPQIEDLEESGRDYFFCRQTIPVTGDAYLLEHGVFKTGFSGTIPSGYFAEGDDGEQTITSVLFAKSSLFDESDTADDALEIIDSELEENRKMLDKLVFHVNEAITKYNETLPDYIMPEIELREKEIELSERRRQNATRNTI